jgi:hypothetical protein
MPMVRCDMSNGMVFAATVLRWRTDETHSLFYEEAIGWHL